MGEIWGQCRKVSAGESLQCLLHEAKNFAVGGIEHDDITAVAQKIPLLLGFRLFSNNLNIQCDDVSILNCESAHGVWRVIARR